MTVFTSITGHVAKADIFNFLLYDSLHIPFVFRKHLS